MDLKTEKEGGDMKEICKYGNECYQKNPAHRARFQHPKTANEDDETLEEPHANLPKKKMKLDEVSALHNISNSSDDEEENDQREFEKSPSKTTVDKVMEENISDDKNEKLIIIDNLKGDIKSKLKELYVVEFPDDFFSFYEFCKSVYLKTPKTALRDIGLELVGPFDLLSGDIKSCTHTQIIRHYRYYFDPPEFYTVLKSTDSKSEFHYGYFFDEPNKSPAFVASNDPKVGCNIKAVAPNIFGVLNVHLNNFVKTSDPFKKMKIQKLRSSLTKWAKEKNFTLETSTLEMKQRNSVSSTKTFHGAGLVVPYDKKTDVGYRPLAENNETLKKLLEKIVESDSEAERNVRWGKIQHVITYAEIATDECDFGTTLELGIDLFCQGHAYFHRTAEQLMTSSYELLGRKHFADVIKVHLKNRVRDCDLNFAALNIL